jgi:hypothetical protein
MMHLALVHSSMLKKLLPISLLMMMKHLFKLAQSTVSPLSTITLLDGGSGYNVGDPVSLLLVVYQTTSAEAIIGSVFGGFPDSANVVIGGAGFQLGGLVSASNVAGTITLAF